MHLTVEGAEDSHRKARTEGLTNLGRLWILLPIKAEFAARRGIWFGCTKVSPSDGAHDRSPRDRDTGALLLEFWQNGTGRVFSG